MPSERQLRDAEAPKVERLAEALEIIAGGIDVALGALSEWLAQKGGKGGDASDAGNDDWLASATDDCPNCANAHHDGPCKRKSVSPLVPEQAAVNPYLEMAAEALRGESLQDVDPWGTARKKVAATIREAVNRRTRECADTCNGQVRERFPEAFESGEKV